MKFDRRLQVIIGILIFILGIAVFMSRTMNHESQMVSRKDVYYCPMHPSYTSDRPGTCPICNMTLVKKEISPDSSEAQKVQKHLNDICIMHNCHKGHDGHPCPMMVMAKKGEKVSCPICGEHIAGSDQDKTAKRIIYWTDPMIPGYKATGPGKSPMGMDLVPVYEETQKNEGVFVNGYTTVAISPKNQQLIGLKSVEVKTRNVFKTLRAYGRVTTNHELYELQDEYIKTYVTFVTVYRDYKRYEHSRRNWESHREVQLKLHEAEDKLLRLGLGPEQIEKLQNVSWAKTWDQPNLLFMDDQHAYWVAAQIYEGDLGYVEVGEEVTVEIPAFSEKAKGVIRSIGGIVNDETRTATALIELKGYRSELKNNMFVNVDIHVELSQVLVVPRDAVMDTGSRKIIFIDKGNGTFEPREIETSWTTDQGFEVKSGLKSGESVVMSGNFLLDSESRLKAAMEGVNTAGGTDGKQ